MGFSSGSKTKASWLHAASSSCTQRRITNARTSVLWVHLPRRCQVWPHLKHVPHPRFQLKHWDTTLENCRRQPTTQPTLETFVPATGGTGWDVHDPIICETNLSPPARVLVRAKSPPQCSLSNFEKQENPPQTRRSTVARVHVGPNLPPHQSLPKFEKQEHPQKKLIVLSVFWWDQSHHLHHIFQVFR